MTKQKDWEKEFDEVYDDLDTYLCCNGDECLCNGETYNKSIKTFIQTLLTQQKKEIVEMVENKRKEFWLDYHNAQKWSEQKAVADSTDDIINTIKNRT